MHATSTRRILIHCPLPEGGLAEHAHYQANALARAGVETVLLASPGFLPDHAGKLYTTRHALLPPYAARGPRLLRAAWMALAIVVNELILAAAIVFGRYRQVLLSATSERLALVWVWPTALLRLFGVRIAANIHDPQRKRLSGSALLHRLSIRASFLPVSIGLIHEDFDTHQPDIPHHVRCIRVPYGCFDTHITPRDGEVLRAEIAPQGSDQKIFLAFGYIADRKNIDLCIRAIATLPQAVLLVAGRVASRHDKPAEWYRALAAELGCSDRVRIDDRFIPERQVRDYFAAADFILLAYKAEFVSQSGVLLLASNWAKPVLASSGPGPLTTTVAAFDLGITVPPDDLPALLTAAKALLQTGYSAAGWEKLRAHACWDRNVAALLDAWDG